MIMIKKRDGRQWQLKQGVVIVSLKNLGLKIECDRCSFSGWPTMKQQHQQQQQQKVNK